MSPSIRAPAAQMPGISAGDRLFVRSAARAFRVLAAFHAARGPLSLTDIAEAAELDRSAAQRLVHTLRRQGYLRRSLDDRGYLPGLMVLDHTLDVLRLDPLVQKATPVLLELRKSVHERVDLSLFDETRMIYALRIQSKRETFYATLVGHSVPTFCTAGGRAALSVLPDARLRDLLERMDRTAPVRGTLTDPEALLREIAAARHAGFAMVSEQYMLGEIAIGVPLALNGRPLGAIHIAGSLSEWEPDEFARQMVPYALEAAHSIMAGF